MTVKTKLVLKLLNKCIIIKLYLRICITIIDVCHVNYTYTIMVTGIYIELGESNLIRTL